MHHKFKDAIKFHKNGDLPNANNILTEILKNEPNNFDVLHLLGVIAFQSGQNLSSVDFLKKAIHVNPNNYEIVSR